MLTLQTDLDLSDNNIGGLCPFGYFVGHMTSASYDAAFGSKR